MRDFEKGEIGVNEWGERMFIRVWLGFIWYTRQKASYAKCSINGVNSFTCICLSFIVWKHLSKFIWERLILVHLRFFGISLGFI